jgi:hypothetical protein
MPAIDFYDYEEVGQSGDLQLPRQYVKNPLIGYALTFGDTAETPVVMTKVSAAGGMIVADNNPLTIPLTGRLTGLDAAYDQLNRLWVAYIQEGEGTLYWYDPLEADYTSFPFGDCTTVMLFMDDVRYWTPQYENKVILLYVRDSFLYYRTQTERFTVEYPLQELGAEEVLVGAGMNSVWRLEIVIESPEKTEFEKGETMQMQYTIAQADVTIGSDKVIGEHTYDGYN